MSQVVLEQVVQKQKWISLGFYKKHNCLIFFFLIFKIIPCFYNTSCIFFNSCCINEVLNVNFGNSLEELAGRKIPRQVPCRSSLDHCLLAILIKLVLLHPCMIWQYLYYASGNNVEKTLCSLKFHLQVLYMVKNDAFKMYRLKLFFFKLYQEQGKYYESYFVLEIFLNWLLWVHDILIRFKIP